MKKEVGIPEGVKVTREDSRIKIVGPRGELERKFRYPGVELKLLDKKIVVESDSNRRKVKAVVGTWAAHLQNMFVGVTEGFEYRLKAVYKHFPISLELRGDELLIKNFFGEKEPRVAKIAKGVDVKINGDEIILKGADVEALGITSSRIEAATKVKGRDLRKFSDGVYITMKKGKKL